MDSRCNHAEQMGAQATKSPRSRLAVYLLVAEGMTFPAVVVARPGALHAQGSPSPVPLRGVPLAPTTGLRLLAAAVPPFVLDADDGSVKVVRGITAANDGSLWVAGVAGRAAVVGAVTRRRTKLFAVRGSSRPVSQLGTGRAVWPSSRRDAVWVQSYVDRLHCTLRQVALNGKIIRARRPFPCASVNAPVVGSTGLVVSRTRVIDPRTGRQVFKTPPGAFNTPLGIVAVAGENVVLEDGPGNELTLMNSATRVRWTLPWPSTIGGLDQPSIDPSGRYVALAFANPSWTSEAGQAFDVWLLDTQSAKLTQLPDMPAFVALKRTSTAWTPDGRLVLLTQSQGADMVAVWQPGQERLAIKTVDLPDRSTSGSDSFALLPPTA
jgi:hypothetical protein